MHVDVIDWNSHSPAQVYTQYYTIADLVEDSKFVGFSVFEILKILQNWPKEAIPKRYTVNLANPTKVSGKALTPTTMAIEFPQINPAFSGKPYKYAYMVKEPFSAGSLILKVISIS